MYTTEKGSRHFGKGGQERAILDRGRELEKGILLNISKYANKHFEEQNRLQSCVVYISKYANKHFEEQNLQSCVVFSKVFFFVLDYFSLTRLGDAFSALSA